MFVRRAWQCRSCSVSRDSIEFVASHRPTPHLADGSGLRVFLHVATGTRRRPARRLAEKHQRELF